MNTAKWKKITVVFIMAVLVAIGTYDILAMAEGGKEASISHALIAWSYEYPSFVFIVGFTMGHLFWRMKNVVLELPSKKE